MFALDASTDGKVFKAVFVQRRLRKYNSLKNAVMGAVKFVKNQLNHYKIIGIKELNKDGYVCWVYAVENDKPRVEYSGELKQKTLSCINNNKESRIEFLKRCHEQHRLRKEQNIKAGETVNNLSDNQTQQKALTFFESFMAESLERAWKEREAKSLFKIELSLSAKGYSWYLDDDNKFVVKPTSQVLDIINKKRKNSLENRQCKLN